MNNTEVLFYLFVLILRNFEVIYATLCGNINGTSCCSGYYWDEIQKRCILCKVGYFGPNCDTKCVYPSYGNDCQSKCNCKDTYCDHVEGCANLTGANICKGQTGAKICCNGFKWKKEETKCIPCDKGYTGHNCEHMCHFPMYGVDCQSMCNCTETQCHPVDGCKEYSSKYETEMRDSPTKAVNTEVLSTNRKQSMLMMGIGVLAAVALFIVLAIFFTYRLENTNKENDSNIYYSIK